VFFTYADIMTKEAPYSGNVMVAFRAKTLEKGKAKIAWKQLQPTTLPLLRHLAPQLLLMREGREKEGSMPTSQ